MILNRNNPQVAVLTIGTAFVAFFGRMLKWKHPPPQQLIHSLIRRFRSVSSQAPHGFTAHSFRLSRCSGSFNMVYTRCFVPRTRCINCLFVVAHNRAPDVQHPR